MYLISAAEVAVWEAHVRLSEADKRKLAYRSVACEECGREIPALRRFTGVRYSLCDDCNVVRLAGPVEVATARFRGEPVVSEPVRPPRRARHRS